MGHARAEQGLDQLRDGRLAEEADAQRGQRDPQLAGREVATGRRAGAARAGRRAPSTASASSWPAGADERELGGHEEAVEQYQHPDGDQEERGHRRTWGARGARRYFGSWVVVHVATGQWYPDPRAPSFGAYRVAHAHRLAGPVGDRDAVRARPRRRRRRRDPRVRLPAGGARAAQGDPRPHRPRPGARRDRPRRPLADRAGAVDLRARHRGAARCPRT